MAIILFDDGKKLGEVSEWSEHQRPAEMKMVLGKEVLSQSSKIECKFVSPKPVHRRSQLWVVVDGKTKMTLKDLKITGGTQVTATVGAKEKL